MKLQESKKWYFHPTIFIKVLWLIFSLFLLALYIFFLTRVLDPFYKKVIGDTAGVVLFICACVMLASLITGILGNLGVCVQNGSSLLYVTHIAFSVVYAIAAIVFIASYGTTSVRQHSYETCQKYIIEHRYEKNNRYIDWFSRNVVTIKNSTDIRDINDDIWDYVDQRTEDIGSATLGGLCAWALFSCLMIYIWLSAQKSPLPQPVEIAQFHSASVEDGSQLNQRILSSSLT